MRIIILYYIWCTSFFLLTYVKKIRIFVFSLKIIAEKFGGNPKSVYLCTRFRPKRVGGGIEKEFFERIT